MPDLKQLALSSADEAFTASIKTMVANLLNAFVLAKSDEDRTGAIARHKTGLRLCREVHDATIAAIDETYG